MGAGASNMSITDLSVYQSSITKIGQNLESRASNINNQTAEGNQTILFKNGTAEGNTCDKRAGIRTESTNSCRTECEDLLFLGVSKSDRIEWLNCLRDYCEDDDERCRDDCTSTYISITDEGIVAEANCREMCDQNAQIITPECTDKQISAFMPSIIGCDIELTQNITQTIGSTQISSAHVDAEMTTDIMNTFENEVEKIINQTNTNLNFNQSNSSQERTKVSQSVRNEISSSIKSIAGNQSNQFAGDHQFIEFTNLGYINCCGNNPCDPNTTDCEIVESMTGSNINESGGVTESSGPRRSCGKIKILHSFHTELAKHLYFYCFSVLL